MIMDRILLERGLLYAYIKYFYTSTTIVCYFNI